MSTSITPTVGRVMWYYPGADDAYVNSAPLAAKVAWVSPDGTRVNVSVLNPGGVPFAAQDVVVAQEGDAIDPGRPHVAWMPYQIGQAKAAATAPFPATPTLTMARGTRWTAEQLQDAQVRMGRIPVAVQRVPDLDKSPGVDIDRVHSKYGNRKVSNEHGKFDSQKEAKRYAELVVLERAGRIAKLRRQVPFALVVNGIHVCDYIADAVYSEGARLVVEDTKSVKTRTLPMYRVKAKLMLACHGITIKEV